MLWVAGASTSTTLSLDLPLLRGFLNLEKGFFMIKRTEALTSV